MGEVGGALDGEGVGRLVVHAVEHVLGLVVEAVSVHACGRRDQKLTSW